MQTAISVVNLSVTLGKDCNALKDINLELPKGKSIGFIGPSGAGKTTLIKVIVGCLAIKTGSVTVFEQPAGSPKLRQQISYMTQELSVYNDLTVQQNLEYFAVMFGQSKKQATNTAQQTLGAVDLTDKSSTLVGSLSGGQKQRVSLAIALIGEPKIMVLDEPTVGLDPLLRQKLWSLFDRLVGQGTTLIISSHSMDEAEHCDDLVLLRDGKVLAHSSPRELCHKTGTKTVEQAFVTLVGSRL